MNTRVCACACACAGVKQLLQKCVGVCAKSAVHRQASPPRAECYHKECVHQIVTSQWVGRHCWKITSNLSSKLPWYTFR